MQHSIDLKAKERQNTQLRDVINWLAVEDHVQDDTLDRFLRRREPGTCDWILANHRLASWLEDNGDEPILWLRGIPGAGKLSLSFLAEPGPLCGIVNELRLFPAFRPWLLRWFVAWLNVLFQSYYAAGTTCDDAIAIPISTAGSHRAQLPRDDAHRLIKL